MIHLRITSTSPYSHWLEADCAKQIYPKNLLEVYFQKEFQLSREPLDRWFQILIRLCWMITKNIPMIIWSLQQESSQTGTQSKEPEKPSKTKLAPWLLSTTTNLPKRWIEYRAAFTLGDSYSQILLVLWNAVVLLKKFYSSLHQIWRKGDATKM